jgi:ABC-2 type transport system permease protein
MLTQINRYRQFKSLFSIYIQDGLAYKASGVIWVLTDVATAATMPLVLAAAAGGGEIAGFSRGEFAVYYLTMIMISSFIQCHFMWEVAYEVKEGIFSTQIIRPVGYLMFMTVRNLAWRCIRSLLFAPFLVLLFLAYQPFMDGSTVSITPIGILAIILGHILSFMFVMAFAMLALFLQEVNSIFEIYYFPMLFLSGQIFPIAIFPEWVRNITYYFPFYYTIALPTEILVGRLSESAAMPFIYGQVGWIIGSYLAFRVMYHYGTRFYSGVGM